MAEKGNGDAMQKIDSNVSIQVYTTKGKLEGENCLRRPSAGQRQLALPQNLNL
jgi:hypothetical protein